MTFSSFRSIVLASLLFGSLWLSPALAQTSASEAPHSSAPASAPPAQTLPPDQVKAIEQLIHDYLLRNPEVILEAVEGLERKRHDEAQQAANSTISARRDDILHVSTSPVAGNPKGDVTIVEFFDYRCPYCKQVEPSLEQLIKEDSKLRFVYKEFPILGPNSVVASHAALAARKQGKYQALHDALMRARGSLDEATIMQIAGDAGLDVKRLKADMNDPEIERIIERNMELARALAINGTPGFIVGNQLIPGAVDLPTLKSLVAEARKAKTD